MQTKTVPNAELIPAIGKLIEEGQEVIFKPKGVSMHPFIRGGRDSVLLRKAGKLKAGDIVLAEISDGMFVLHRIEKIEDEKIVLMGDGNLVGRERCRRNDVLAIAVKIIKGQKEIDCQSQRHLRNAAIWRRLLPVRRYLLAIYRRIIL
jgi:SOS-response transcriptional repressor LexA